MIGEELARRIEEANPWWFVLYEPVNREIIALPRFKAPPMTVIRNTDPSRVVQDIRRIEELFLKGVSLIGGNRSTVPSWGDAGRL